MDTPAKTGFCQDVSVPLLGQGLHELLENYSFLSSPVFLDVCPPNSYDYLLQQVAYSVPLSCTPEPTLWTCCTLTNNESRSAAHVKLKPQTKYKTVDCKVCPVPSYMPDPAGQVCIQARYYQQSSSSYAKSFFSFQFYPYQQRNLTTFSFHSTPTSSRPSESHQHHVVDTITP